MFWKKSKEYHNLVWKVSNYQSVEIHEEHADLKEYLPTKSDLENLSEKKDKCDKHIVSAIHHFEDCLYKLGYDLSDINPSPTEEGN